MLFGLLWHLFRVWDRPKKDGSTREMCFGILFSMVFVFRVLGFRGFRLLGGFMVCGRQKKRPFHARNVFWSFKILSMASVFKALLFIGFHIYIFKLHAIKGNQYVTLFFLILRLYLIQIWMLMRYDVLHSKIGQFDMKQV